jgi:hypothetical protein
MEKELMEYNWKVCGCFKPLLDVGCENFLYDTYRELKYGSKLLEPASRLSMISIRNWDSESSQPKIDNFFS